MTKRAAPKPLDYMSLDELDRFAVEMLTEAMQQARKLRGVGRWRRSKFTDAICNAGPDWHPGMPLTGRNGETLIL